LEVVCDEHSIGGGGDYCGDIDAQLGRINVLYYEASGGKYAPRTALMNLGPGVIGAVRASPLGELFHPGSLVNQKKSRRHPSTPSALCTAPSARVIEVVKPLHSRVRDTCARP
jgi:hypothetical protein